MKKPFVSLLLALMMCLGLLPATASAAETAPPDWYFLFAVFKNADADGTSAEGEKKHAKYTMPQDEIDDIKKLASDFEEYMNQVGAVRAHVDVVEIDTAVTDLADSDYGSWLSAEKAEPLLRDKADLDKYDFVACTVSLGEALHTTYQGITSNPFSNGTGHTCVNFKTWEYCRDVVMAPDSLFPVGTYVHEFLHFTDYLNRKWGGGYGLHAIGNFYDTGSVDGWRGCYTDILLNRAKGRDGTGVSPLVWRFSPRVLRAAAELSIPSGVTGIGEFAFSGRTALAGISIPASVTSIGRAAFYRSGVKDVYYAGTEEQWKAIRIGEHNEQLTNAAIHCNSLMADVKTTDPFAPSIAWALENGVTGGTGGGKFSPGSPCTQAQILTFLWRAKGSPAPDGAAGGSEYYASAVQWAREQGLLDGTFSPAAPCTRAMAVTYLWKLAGSPKAKAASFSDVPASAGYAAAVSWAVEQGVTSGTGADTFAPDRTCTRGQIVTFLYRALAE